LQGYLRLQALASPPAKSSDPVTHLSIPDPGMLQSYATFSFTCLSLSYHAVCCNIYSSQL